MNAATLTRDALRVDLARLGVGPGVLLLHSRFSALEPVEGGPQGLIDVVRGLLGPDGTLIAPTFSFRFCVGEPWSARTSPSDMGIVSEFVRTHPLARRSVHPIYSVAALGTRAEEVAALRARTCYGADSIFARLRAWDAQLLVLGLSWNDSLTFVHHVEEMERASYRYDKEFAGEVWDAAGGAVESPWPMYVRDLARRVRTAFDPALAQMECAGTARVGPVGRTVGRLVRARACYDHLATILREGRAEGLLYRVEEAR